MTQTHMAREVAEIPQAAARFLDQSRQMVLDAAAALRRKDPDLVVTVARGSSDHAATYLKYAIELEAGVPVASVGPSIASIYRRPLRLGKAACLGISQSGRSPDIVEMMRASGDGGALSIAITNFEHSPMATASAHCLPLQAGEEKSVAATKTFVTSVLAGLSLLAEWREDHALQDAVAGLPDAFAQAINLDWSALSARLARANSAFVLGRGPGFAIACEAALKFKETCGLHAEAYSAAEVLHGPAAIVQASFPVLALGIEDAALPQLKATAERLAAQGADVFVTGTEVGGAVTLPSVGDLHPLVAPLVTIAGFYAFIEGLARRRGFDPDTPPHLRKVTETV
ncbi:MULTISPECIES: SIS domain-containing protein [unclassified Paracoccus (in: a-proteobacteria)]|uniref:SIS domain-containing protein n=1 Tax=unclassified Paracoccus (in: a-proteobacteria) TaxID=2688777 RepID=UPI0012B3610B|nr:MULTISPECIES: SIS domain-containing protein [unclassified Paracoccus (in: a-proteobacteria)]UXU74211.1 SIS domain-containing protein [Paracoccus sp. SMMA_5]UXU80099.1 SIS domain-containing protein [Paracoccus sp. SMMA_5_TC]